MRLLDHFKKPLVVGIAGVVVGLLLGLLVGWVLWPVEWTDATPQAMSQKYQVDYLRMAIDAFRMNPDADLAYTRYQNLGPNANAIYQNIKQNPGTQDMAAITNFGDAVKARLATEAAGGQNGGVANENGNGEETAGQLKSGISNYVLYGVVGVLGLLVLAAIVYYVPRLFGKSRVAPENYSAARQAQEIAKSTEKTDFSKMGLQEPVTRTMTTYVLGDDLYDESFSIDAPAGEFLGEYGVGVSEAIGVGDPKKVTAIEIWLFDKNDIKTATKVLMTPHAFNDPNIRARLEAKGELELAEPQKQVLLETATLQLLATLVDLEFGKGNMPDKSYYERITLELAIWPKG